MKKTLKSKNSAGFALSELLVMIAILALLASIILVSLSSGRVKSRDARRKADLRQVFVAMKQYYDANSTYPIFASDACSTVIPNCSGAYPSSIGTFLPVAPRDPSNTATYYYRVKASAGKDFCVIAANLEGESSSFYANQNGLDAAAAGATACP